MAKTLSKPATTQLLRLTGLSLLIKSSLTYLSQEENLYSKELEDETNLLFKQLSKNNGVTITSQEQMVEDNQNLWSLISVVTQGVGLTNITSACNLFLNLYAKSTKPVKRKMVDYNKAILKYKNFILTYKLPEEYGVTQDIDIEGVIAQLTGNLVSKTQE